MRTPFGTFIIIVIMILLDIYVFMAIKSVSHSVSSKLRTLIFSIYWLVAIVAIAGLLLFIFTGPEFLPKKVRTYLFASILAFVFGQLVSSVFFLIDDVRPENLVRFDCRDYDGRPVQTRFRFNSVGEMVHTNCVPIGSEG